MHATSPPAPHPVETPSGKGSRDENFPVASILLPARLRPHVMTFYAFARAADDIADNPDLSPEDKVARLDRFEAALLGDAAAGAEVDKAARLRRSLAETGVTPRHGVDLLVAFKQDAVKLRYADWDDLMGYCFKSAAPVGRYLLDLHGETPERYPPSDALCNALQILNHLQDCGDDHRNLDRVYLPLDMLGACGVRVEALAAPAASPGLRRALDRVLDRTDALLREAQALPFVLRHRGLALESAVILAIAERLSAELRRRDPLAERVVLTKGQALSSAARGVLRRLRGRWR